jgi:predicted Zn-dependent peptidase
MLSLAFGEKSLETQRKVVCEEFKEHYLTKPYGDVWHKMRELAYKKHPYRWMTIGKELSHIEEAKLEEVKNFFFKHYRPVNAVMVVAGNVTTDKVKELAEKWFGDIPAGEKYMRNLPEEEIQTEARRLEIKADVPLDAFYKCWHMCNRLDKDYHAVDLMTDILSGGGSSRLYQSLVKEKQLFSNIECHHFGSTDNGLVVVEGKLVKGVAIADAEKAVEEELEKIKNELVSEAELQKVKNKTESMIAFEDMSVMSRANSLAYYELLGDANWMNEELDKYAVVTVADIQELAKKIFREENSNTLYYLSQN